MYISHPSRTITAVAAAGVFVATGRAAAIVINVPLDAPTIQAAIDLSDDGDVVEVTDGTWTGPGNRNLDFGGRLITVRSISGDPLLCTIDCENNTRGFVFQSGEGETAVVSGFTILNGSAPGTAGGGIMVIGSNPTIINCIFRSNASQVGAGMSLQSSNSLVTNCQFIANDATALGAGMHIVGGAPELTNCVFFDNIALGNGGGLNVTSGTLVSISNCTFAGNDALFFGGGIRSTLASLPQLTNCILWGNLDASGSVQIAQIAADTAPSVLYSTVQGSWPGTGNISGDPLFINAGAGDLRLGAGSAAIDAGSNTVVPDDTSDLDGDGDLLEAVPLDLDLRVRFHDDPDTTDIGIPGNGFPDDVVDMGAYEFGAEGAPLKIDLLWHHDNGQVLIWLMDGTEQIETGSPGIVGAPWQIVGTGDFDGDGHSDILWHEMTTGQLVIWFIDGTQRVDHGSAGSVNPTLWEVAGVADFDGLATTATSTADILWRHTTTGQTVVWLMDGAQVISSGSPGSANVAEWEIAGVGDFDGDGHADILWHRTTTGQAYIWFLEGVLRVGAGTVGSADPNQWQIVGIGNFDGVASTATPTADILWQHKNGQVVIWLLDGVQRIGDGSPGSAGGVWQIEDTGDFDGDGNDDILWRNQAASGLVFVWFIEGTARIGLGPMGGVPHEWQIVGTANFDDE